MPSLLLPLGWRTSNDWIVWLHEVFGRCAAAKTFLHLDGSGWSPCALHTLDLPKGNRTPDNEILDLAEQDERVVITKDDDFVQSFLLSGRPPKLLLIATGNISNMELEKMVRTNLDMIVEALATSHFIEIGRDTMLIHE